MNEKTELEFTENGKVWHIAVSSFCASCAVVVGIIGIVYYGIESSERENIELREKVRQYERAAELRDDRRGLPFRIPDEPSMIPPTGEPISELDKVHVAVVPMGGDVYVYVSTTEWKDIQGVPCHEWDADDWFYNQKVLANTVSSKISQGDVRWQGALHPPKQPKNEE